MLRQFGIWNRTLSAAEIKAAMSARFQGYENCRPVPGQTRVFIQIGGRLVDETASRAPVRDNLTHDSDAADIDGDGNLDVYLADIKLVSDPPFSEWRS